MKFIAYCFAALAVALVVVGIVAAVGSASAAAASTAVVAHGMASGPSLAGIGNLLVNLAIVAVITAVVSPIKQRLVRKRQASAPDRRQPAQASTSQPI